MNAALDPELSAAVLAIAAELFPSGFDVSDNAPETYEALRAQTDTHGRMIVYGGASDQTIFGDAAVNHAFRAWHDYHHYHGYSAFTPKGEARACAAQIVDVFLRYGVTEQTQRWAALLDAEVNGQLAYAAAHRGIFPTDQKAFVTAYLDKPAAAVIATF